MAYGGLEGRENLRKEISDVSKGYQEVWREHAIETARMASEAGAFDILDSIEKTESALRPGKIGRVLSGKMRQNVGASHKRTGNTYTARSGWLGEKERYFYIQEHGGVGYGIYKGQPIWGMNALRAARWEMEKVVVKEGYKFE